MTVMGIFDAMFVNQLFGRSAGGETVYYPNGPSARGYLVPPDREPGLRSALRQLVVLALFGAPVLAVIVTRLVEGWLGFELPLAWFVGGVVVAGVLGVVAIIRALARLTDGLTPASAGG